MCICTCIYTHAIPMMLTLKRTISEWHLLWAIWSPITAMYTQNRDAFAEHHHLKIQHRSHKHNRQARAWTRLIRQRSIGNQKKVWGTLRYTSFCVVLYVHICTHTFTYNLTFQSPFRKAVLRCPFTVWASGSSMFSAYRLQLCEYKHLQIRP